MISRLILRVYTHTDLSVFAYFYVHMDTAPIYKMVYWLEGHFLVKILAELGGNIKKKMDRYFYCALCSRVGISDL